MKTYPIKFIQVLMIALAIFAMASCEKPEDDDDQPKNVQSFKTTTVDNAVAEWVSNDLWQQVNLAIAENSGQFQKMADVDSICADITINNNGGSYPKSMVIDFGGGCTDIYGITRSGVITASITGPYIQAGTVLTISSTNYTVRGFTFEGTKTITNDGKNSAGHSTFTVSEQGIKITSPVGDHLIWNSTRVNEWVQGENTWFVICDDVYNVTGSASGTNTAGETFTITITDPLVKNVCCAYVSAGMLSVSLPNLGTATVDYGNGSCDGQFVVSYNGNNYNYSVQ